MASLPTDVADSPPPPSLRIDATNGPLKKIHITGIFFQSHSQVSSDLRCRYTTVYLTSLFALKFTEIVLCYYTAPPLRVRVSDCLVCGTEWSQYTRI